MAYLTVSEYRARLAALTTGQPSYDDRADYDFHQACLTGAQQFIEQETGRRFEAATQTRYFAAQSVKYDDPALLIVDDDLLSVTTLTNGDGALIASNLYWLEPFNSLPAYGVRLKTTAAWAFSADGRVSVAGSWGYMAAANEDVKRVMARLAYLEQQRRTNTGEVLAFEGGVTYGAPVPGDVARWLERMRRRRPR